MLSIAIYPRVANSRAVKWCVEYDGIRREYGSFDVAEHIAHNAAADHVDVHGGGSAQIVQYQTEEQYYDFTR